MYRILLGVSYDQKTLPRRYYKRLKTAPLGWSFMVDRVKLIKPRGAFATLEYHSLDVLAAIEKNDPIG
jgi:hypothetical protein